MIVLLLTNILNVPVKQRLILFINYLKNVYFIKNVFLYFRFSVLPPCPCFSCISLLRQMLGNLPGPV